MKKLAFLALSTVLSAPAIAQDTSIVVVASGAVQPVEVVGQSVSVAGQEEIDAVQGADLTRLLERLPGLSFTRNGGLGAQTGIFVRGANADQLLVMIDGVRVADYASPGGGYDLGNLLAGNLAKVELLRGSNSVVWGSQAVGGVLALTTREVNGAEAMAEYGANDTIYATATAGIAREGHALSLTGGYADSDGISARSGGTERDGYRQWSLAGRGRVALGEGLTLSANGRYADSRLGIDLAGPDSPDVQDSREGSGRIALAHDGGGLKLSAAYARSFVRRAYDGVWGPSSYRGRADRAELAGLADLAPAWTLTFGADSEWTRAKSTFDPRQKARIASGHALLGWQGEGASLAAGVRVDDHNRFGTHATFGANGSVDLAQGFRLRASFGEGFKAPTLYQLFGGFVGNPGLKPERSRSYDIGLEKGDRNGPLHLAATLFRRDSRNLIDLDNAFVYQNVAKARAEGLELELASQLNENVRARAAYTWLRARDRTLGRDLARRPRHAVTTSIDWTTPLAGLALGADLRMASDAVEYAWGGAVLRLDGYAVASLRASLPVADRFELFGRIENLGGTNYETAAGFNTPGRSAYFGARARF